jgi:hypothetical protein
MAADCNVAVPEGRPEVTTAVLEQQHASLEQLAEEIAARSAHTTRKTQASPDSRRAALRVRCVRSDLHVVQHRVLALQQPRLGGRGEYLRRFVDVEFWTPYVLEVMRRHGIPDAQIGVGAGGTFPTFLFGEHVAKFFPRRFHGGECFAIER